MWDYGMNLEVLYRCLWRVVYDYILFVYLENDRVFCCERYLYGEVFFSNV